MGTARNKSKHAVKQSNEMRESPDDGSCVLDSVNIPKDLLSLLHQTKPSKEYFQCVQ